MPYKNKGDQHASQRRWYQRNRKYQIEKGLKRKKILRYKKKKWLIDNLGGSCIKCGYDGCPASFDMHHDDPETKDDIEGQAITGQSWKYLREHLNDFTLLCANCHREHHYIPQPL